MAAVNRLPIMILAVFALAAAMPAPLQADSPGYVGLLPLCREIGTVLEWDHIRDMGVLRLGRKAAVVSVGVPWVILDYSRTLPTVGLMRDHDVVYVPEATAKELRLFFKQEPVIEGGYRVAAIVLDPGHGGRDPGTVKEHRIDGKKILLKEKDIALRAGLRLQALLKDSYPDKKVLLTRSDDRFISLEDRPEIANSIKVGKNEAIIYISIHVNASLNKAAKGFEVWYLAPSYRRDLVDRRTLPSEYHDLQPLLNTMKEEEYTWESVLLARSISMSMDRETGRFTENRGLKAGQWLVVRQAKMPSILVELGFLTHPEEGPRLAEESYLQNLSRAVYTGISSFIDTYEKSRGFTE